MTGKYYFSWLRIIVLVCALCSIPKESTIAGTPVSPPDGLDFSGLSTDNPVTEFSVSEGQYKEVLDTQWIRTTNSSLKWIAPFKNTMFSISPSVFSHPKTDAYLVSPAIDLEACAGYKFSFMESSVFDSNLPLEVLVINAQGETLATLHSDAPAPSNDFSLVETIVPEGLSGVGFIAFRYSSDGEDFKVYKVKDISLAPASTDPEVRVDPASLSWDVVDVGESSFSKSVSVIVTNNTEALQVQMAGSHPNDFKLLNEQELQPTGGGLQIVFVPTEGGTRTATVKIVAGTASAEISLQGEARGGGGGVVVPEPLESTELLTDPYFYDFQSDDTPLFWSSTGSVYKIEKGYHPDTGFAVELNALEGTKASLYQEVDLSISGKEVLPGNVIEGIVRYKGLAPKNPEGALRLACYWVDEQGNKIAVEEDLFINNSTTYFDKQKAWGQVRFRSTAPAGAAKFVFGVETNTNSLVQVDDCSLLLLSQSDREREFVSVIPEIATHTGETLTPIVGHMLVQGFGLVSEKYASIAGPIGELVLSQDPLPIGNSVQDISYTITAKKKGVYAPSKNRQYGIVYNAVEPVSGITLVVNVTEQGNPPSAKLADGATSVETFYAMENETDESELVFEFSSGIIDHVNLAVVQEAGGPFRISTTQFYYGATAEQLFGNKVKVAFNPRQVGEYKAQLQMSSTGMDTLYWDLTGVCTSMGDGWVEQFSEDKALPENFSGEGWTDYHRFDRGYYKLQGAWKSQGVIEIEPNGILDCDELFAYGIKRVRLTGATDVLKLYYTLDGGGHWMQAQGLNGAFNLNFNRATRFKVVNDSNEAVELTKIEVLPGDKADVQVFPEITAAMFAGADEEALSLLKEDFNFTRHTRGIDLPGWQTIIVQGDRPFRGWAQKNIASGKVEEQCAQITFYNSLVTEDTGSMEAWLVSPTLSYKNAKSSIFTFRLRYQLPTEDGQEKFGVFIIPEKDGKIGKPQFLDITKLLLVPVVDKDKWYDYFIDLSKIPEIEIDDLFHIAFSFYSPTSGRTTTLNFMIDDVTFGRTDYTRVNTDKDMLTFKFYPTIKTETQTVMVTTEYPDQSLSVILEPAHLQEQFLIDTYTLPASGGPIEVAFKSKEEKNRAAALLIQSRGGESRLVKLMAMNATHVDLPQANEEFYLFPTIANDVIHFAGMPFAHYFLFSTDGNLLQQGNYTETLSVDHLAPGKYLVRVVTNEGFAATALFVKE